VSKVPAGVVILAVPDGLISEPPIEPILPHEAELRDCPGFGT
jgi:hypothetical protein